MQITFMGVWPDAIGISGTALVIASVVGIALEEQYMGKGSHDDGAEEASVQEPLSSAEDSSATSAKASSEVLQSDFSFFGHYRSLR